MAITGRTGVFSGRADALSSGLAAIQHEHLKIHEGVHYFYAGSITLEGSSYSYAINSPSSSYVFCHLVFNVMGASGFNVTLEEDDAYADGSLETLYNNDRNSANASETTLYSGVTPVGGGTVLWTQSVDMGTAAIDPIVFNLGTSRPEEEIILETNKTYILTIDSDEALSAEAALTLAVKINIYEFHELKYYEAPA